jgi:hypothetical protein
MDLVTITSALSFGSEDVAERGLLNNFGALQYAVEVCEAGLTYL